MSITPAQIRQARALLGWSSARLARRSFVGFDKVLKAQDDEATATMSELDLRMLWDTLEAAGVVFEPDGPVRLRGEP